jgi:enoyl-CoA hydratase/carnithine racemase
VTAGLRLEVEDRVATLTLDRPERKNPLTFELYATLRDWFRGVGDNPDVRAVVLSGAGGNFCSGGDVHEIIGPLVESTPEQLLDFTRLTGSLVEAMLGCPAPIVAAVEGVCAGAGAILAMSSDIRLATAETKTSFLFTRVGLAGCDMGACAILPRIIGHGRAAELLLTGRTMGAEEGERCGFFSRLVEPGSLHAEAAALASTLAHGPTFAHALTKRQLRAEWAMGIDEALAAEAEAQALCMQTNDFARAYRAFLARERPVFEGD